MVETCYLDTAYFGDCWGKISKAFLVPTDSVKALNYYVTFLYIC